jgi:alkylated DNA repair dioxygenase AlkB
MQTIADWQKLGLTLLLDFISLEEEQQLVDGIASTYRPSIGITSAKYRNSIHRFGVGDIYKDNLISNVIPDYFAPSINKLVAEQHIAGQPDAVTVNEYLAGQRIHPHIDAPEAGPVITVLSLLSPAVMVFTCGDAKFEIGLPPRSLVQMRDVIRTDWYHAILPVEATRYSIVFRGKSC